MRHQRSFWLILALAVLSASMYGEPIPQGCAVSLMSVRSASGSPAYIRLRYEIEALASAQHGVTMMSQAFKAFKAESDPPIALAAIITGANNANDDLLCASAVMQGYAATRNDDPVIKEVLTEAFNKEATVVTALQADIKRRISIAVDQSGRTLDVAEDTARMSMMQAEQEDAAESLRLAVFGSLTLALDVSDINGRNTSKTTLTCGEVKDLWKRSSAIVRGQKSVYRDDASLVLSFLDGHECNGF